MLVKSLGQLEQQVMDIMWQHKQCTVREVLQKFKHVPPLAYTTVATILDRLCQKQILHFQKQGVIKLYLPRISKQTYTKSLIKNFMKKIFDTYGDMALTSFVQSFEELPRNKRLTLIRLLDNKQNAK